MTARLAFKKVPEGYEEYVGKTCGRGDHEGCPGGFGRRVGFLCGGPGAGPIVSTEEGAPCACSCHDEGRRVTAPRNERGHRTRVVGRNDCPNPACGRTKPRDKAFCLPCWRLIPFAVQRQVYASYRAGDIFAHIDYLDRLGERLAAGLGDWPAPAPARACRVCGCNENDACAGGCWWAEDDLCSACEDRLADESATQGEPIR